MLYILYRIGSFLALTLPLKLSYWLAEMYGSFYYLLAGKDRRIARENLKVVLGQNYNPPKVRHLTRKIFVNFARYLVEFFRAPKIDSAYLEKHITLEGKKNLEQALNLGRGVILVSAHLGNWELGGMFLGMLGYKVNVIAWTHKNSRINHFFLRQRKSKGVSVIPLGMGIKKVFFALRNQEIVGLLGDVDYAAPERGITVKLFGRDTVLPKGPAEFSLKAAAPIVPVFMLRENEDRFRMVLEEPIIYQMSADEELDLTKLTQLVALAMQPYIRLYPEQWFMLTPRWSKNN